LAVRWLGSFLLESAPLLSSTIVTTAQQTNLVFLQIGAAAQREPERK